MHKTIYNARGLKRVSSSHGGCTIPAKLTCVDYGGLQSESQEKLTGKLNVARRYAKYARKGVCAKLSSGKLKSDVREHRIVIVEEGVQIEANNDSNPAPAAGGSGNGSGGGVNRSPCTIRDIAIELLTEKSLLESLVAKLYDCGLLRHYIAHFELLATGKLSCENIAIVLALEVAFWHSLKSTTNMVYHILSKGGLL